MGVAQLLIRQVCRVSADRHAEVPKVYADLIGAASDGPCLKDRRAIRITPLHGELGERVLAFFFINRMRTKAAGLCADGGIAAKSVLNRMTRDPDEVNLFNSVLFELLLNQFGKVPRTGAEHEAGSIRVETMHKLGSLRSIDLAEYVLEGVAIESPARVHR